MSEKIATLLSQLEAEMRAHGFWQQKPPSEEALGSTQPFCVDTLEFHEWLQFIFVARLRVMLEHGHALPQGSGVLPMAEEYFKSQKGAKNVLKVISDIDEGLGRAAYE